MPPDWLRASRGALLEDHDLVMLDLDGVVYVGADAVPGAPEHLAAVRESGVHVAFITNNAARPPGAVAEHLRDLGVEAATDDVVTSAQAAAHVLVERYGVGARIAVLGAEGLEAALRDERLEPVAVDDEAAEALASGYGPDVRWREVMRAAVRVRAGLPWVASNADLTLPTPDGPAPGHGVLVELLERFSGQQAEVAGKPERPLLDETVRRVGGESPLMVGDRLDTDIEGARRADLPSLLVMTGVTGVAELAGAAEPLRPTYLAADLGGLRERHEEPVADDGAWTSGGWRAEVVDGRARVDGDGSVSDWWRALAAACWAYLDDAGEPAQVDDLRPPEPR
jgi:HAD superfamily hydrolase (TIGR01450 family)